MPHFEVKVSSASKRYQPKVDESGRVCRECGEWKEWNDFHSHPNGINGRTSRCKVCILSATSKRRSTPEAKARIAAYDLARREREGAKEAQAERDRLRQADPERRARNNELRRTDKARERQRAQRKRRKEGDLLFVLGERAREMVHRCLRASGEKKPAPTFQILGYDSAKLKQRMECQFQSGMSWQNHGRGNGKWHIDHKKPVSAFLRQGITDPRAINALCNLQPMWETENLSKNDRWPLIAANDNNQKVEDAA